MIESPTIPPPFYVRQRAWIVALLTFFGAILRFWSLDVPGVWGDEALTYSRVIGSWREMFEILRDDGFMPLHYILYWCQHQITPLTPESMRIIPSLCGVAMIPAMYFLGRQLADVRTGLLSAAFACVSAYLFRYSHDAKMYMQTWLFVALNLAALLWWLNSNRKWAAALWFASGLIAIGFSMLAAIMIAPQPIIFLSARRHTLGRCLFFSAGMIAMAFVPAWYFSHISQWVESTGQSWDSSGIAWVEEFNRGSTAPMLVRESLSGYLVGYEWTDSHIYDVVDLRNRRDYAINPKIKAAFTTSYCAILALSLLGSLPWKSNRHSADSSRTEGWKPYFWLGTLLLVSIYGVFYCRSVRGFAAPWESLSGLVQFSAGWVFALPIGWMIVTLIQRKTFERARAARFVYTSVGLFALACLIYFLWRAAYTHHWETIARQLGQPTANELMYPDLAWKSIWMPRYLGVIWPVLAVAVSMLILRLPTRPVRYTAILFFLAINLAGSIARMVVTIEPPHAMLFADVKQSRDSQRAVQVFLTSLDATHKRRSEWLQSSWFGVYGSAGKFYACTTLGLHPTPEEFRSGGVTGEYMPWLGDQIEPEEIPLRADLNASGKRTQRVIVWERSSEVSPPPEDYPAEDRIIAALKYRWNLVDTKLLSQRNPNDWSRRGWIRRREFVHR